VVFSSEIYHPMVSAETGELDLGEELSKNWNYGTEHLIFTVVEHIRLIFIDVKKYELVDSLNRKAGELFKSNVDEFFIKVTAIKRRCASVWRPPSPSSTTTLRKAV
jgi:ubiquitin-protein ligase